MEPADAAHVEQLEADQRRNHALLDDVEGVIERVEQKLQVIVERRADAERKYETLFRREVNAEVARVSAELEVRKAKLGAKPTQTLLETYAESLRHMNRTLKNLDERSRAKQIGLPEFKTDFEEDVARLLESRSKPCFSLDEA